MPLLMPIFMVEAFVIGDGVRVRERPSKGAAVIRTLRRGERVQLRDERQGTFCGIEFDGGEGFVACSYLSEQAVDAAPTAKAAGSSPEASPTATKKRRASKSKPEEPRSQTYAVRHHGITGEAGLGISRGNFTLVGAKEPDLGYALRASLGYAWPGGFMLGGSIGFQQYVYEYVLQTSFLKDELVFTLASVALDVGWIFTPVSGIEFPLTLKVGNVSSSIDGRLISDEASGELVCLALGLRVVADMGATIGISGDLCENGVTLSGMEGHNVESAMFFVTFGGR